MWFLVFLTYWTLSVAIEQEPLIEALPNHSFSTPVFHNSASCWAYGARSTGNAWCAGDARAAAAQVDQYIQVDLLETYKIHSVSTWPRKDYPSQYVKTYRLSYSMDGETFTVYPKIFNGNTAAVASQEINNVLDPDITARYLRFTPLAYNAQAKSMRIEAYGNKAEIEPIDHDCDDFEIDDECLASWLDLYLSNGNAYAMPDIPDIDDYDGVKINEKNWFDNYRDYLTILSLILNVLVIGIIVYVACTGKKKEYEFKNVDSSDNENDAINM